MSAPALVASPAVHIEIPGFQALSERNHWDTCAIIAEMDALNVCAWAATKFTSAASIYARLVSWRGEYLAAINPATGKPRFTPGAGTTLGNIHWHLTKHQAHLAGYIPYSDTPNLTALHAFIKAQTLAQNPVIIQVVNAQALPHAEQGVKSHFVCLGGIDSVQGYLVANGDTTDALTTSAFLVPLYWTTWQQLVNAQIVVALALDRGWTPPPPPPPPPVVPVIPIGLADAITQAEALVAALKAMEG